MQRPWGRGMAWWLQEQRGDLLEWEDMGQHSLPTDEAGLHSPQRGRCRDLSDMGSHGTVLTREDMV